MWFVDVVVDIHWFVKMGGKLGRPQARARQPIPEFNCDNEFLLYGDQDAIRHLRVLLHEDSEEPPHAIVDANIQRWVNLLEVSSGLVGPQTATAATLTNNCNLMMVILQQGDETSDAIQLEPYQIPHAVNYQDAVKMMSLWNSSSHVHLIYLGRFLNTVLPPEVRWLNGYKLLEWHFKRGDVSLNKDRSYRAFIDEHGQAFDRLLKPKQARYNFIEEVRAQAAHAILSSPGSTNLILQSFSALESLVVAILNESLAEGVRFEQKQASAPIKSG